MHTIGAGEGTTSVIKRRPSKATIASRRLRESLAHKAFVNNTMEKLVMIADGQFLLMSPRLEMLLRPRTVKSVS